MNIYEYRAGELLKNFHYLYIYIYILLCLLFNFKLAYNLLSYVFKIISDFLLLYKDCLITFNSKRIFLTITMLSRIESIVTTSFLYFPSCYSMFSCCDRSDFGALKSLHILPYAYSLLR